MQFSSHNSVGIQIFELFKRNRQDVLPPQGLLWGTGKLIYGKTGALGWKILLLGTTEIAFSTSSGIKLLVIWSRRSFDYWNTASGISIDIISNFLIIYQCMNVGLYISSHSHHPRLTLQRDTITTTMRNKGC